MSSVVIYTKLGCPFCEAAREDLKSRGIEYEDISVPGNSEAEADLARLTNGENIVPVIVDGKKVEVGFGGG
jgi:glutaredoxin 3